MKKIEVETKYNTTISDTEKDFILNQLGVNLNSLQLTFNELNETFFEEYFKSFRDSKMNQILNDTITQLLKERNELSGKNTLLEIELNNTKKELEKVKESEDEEKAILLNKYNSIVNKFIQLSSCQNVSLKDVTQYATLLVGTKEYLKYKLDRKWHLNPYDMELMLNEFYSNNEDN
jgi:hypothetical protein